MNRAFQVLREQPCSLDPWSQWRPAECRCAAPRTAVGHFRALLARWDAGERSAVWQPRRLDFVKRLAEAERQENLVGPQRESEPERGNG